MRAAIGSFCIGLGLFSVGAAADEASTMPRPLACYKRYYGLDSERRDGRWVLKLKAGAALVYDDGEAKDAAARLARPDVEDQFVPAYRTGPLNRETGVDRDPGRIRVMAILRALYGEKGAGGAAAEADLTRIDWFGARLRVHRRIEPALSRVAARIEAAIAADKTLRPWLDRPGGTFANRRIAGTDRTSPHAFGIAIDIDPQRSEYWRWDRDSKRGSAFARPLPAALVAAFEAEGFIWGGRWYHYDTMHFEYRPEILDPTCAP